MCAGNAKKFFCSILTDLDSFPKDATKKPFHGARELAALIAQTQSARDCMVLQYYRYGRGYVEDAERDQCTLAALKSKFAASDGDLKSLLLDYVRDDSFIRRRAE